MSTKLCRRVFWRVNMQSLARLHSAPRVPVSGHGAHAEAGVFAHTSRPSIGHARGRWWARRQRRAGGRLNAG